MTGAGGDGGTGTAPASRLHLGATVALLMFSVLVGRWMLAPFDDWVPLVASAEISEADEAKLPKAARYRCSAAVGEDEAAVASRQATDALEVQDLTREPCTAVRSQHRTLGILDLVVAGALLLVMVGLRRRHRAVGRVPGPVAPSP